MSHLQRAEEDCKMAFGIFHESVKCWWTQLLHNLHYSESAMAPKIISQTKLFLEDLGIDLVKPMMERKTMSFVGLAKPIQQAMFVCGITPAACVDYSQDEQGPTKSKRKRCYRCTMD